MIYRVLLYIHGAHIERTGFSYIDTIHWRTWRANTDLCYS